MKSTKSQPFAATFRLSKLFRILATAVILKLVLVVSLIFDMPANTLQSASAPEAVTSRQPAAAPDTTAARTEKTPEKMKNAPQHIFRANLSGSTAYAAEPGLHDTTSEDTDPMLREALQRKQAELDRREQELNNLQKDIENRLNDLKDMEVRLQVMLKEANVQKDQKMRHLVDVYTNMKPKQAGQVLETLDERTAVRILAGMRGRQAGEILTFVSPEKAAKLSEMLTRMQMPFE